MKPYQCNNTSDHKNSTSKDINLPTEWAQGSLVLYFPLDTFGRQWWHRRVSPMAFDSLPKYCLLVCSWCSPNKSGRMNKSGRATCQKQHILVLFHCRWGCCPEGLLCSSNHWCRLVSWASINNFGYNHSTYLDDSQLRNFLRQGHTGKKVVDTSFYRSLGILVCRDWTIFIELASLDTGV